MFTFINIAAVTAFNISRVLKLDIPDFDNTLLMQCTKRCEIDIIATRNKNILNAAPSSVSI